MCAREDIGASSMLRLIRRGRGGAVALARMLPTLNLSWDSGSRKQRGENRTGPGCVAHAQLLKLQKKRVPDEAAKTKCAWRKMFATIREFVSTSSQ